LFDAALIINPEEMFKILEGADVDAQELSPEATDNEVLAMASRLAERDLSRSHTVSKEENRFLVRPSAVYG